MNEHADESELPELTDNDVELLYKICKRASASSDPPFKALFAAYDHVFVEHEIEQQHDGVVFRYLMRVGESTRAANRSRHSVDLAERLKSVLQAQGITVVDPSQDGNEDITQPINNQTAIKERQFERPQRRVSFDDARFEETWLGQHSEPVSPAPPPARSSLLSLPPRRGRIATSTRRTRSTSSQRDLPFRTAAPKHFHQTSTDSASQTEDRFNPTLLFEPSQTQLEQNAEAFHSTSALRSARRAVRTWREAVIQLQEADAEAYTIAAAHDRRTLLKQSLDQWLLALETKREEHGRFQRLHKLEEKAMRYRDLYLLTKAFTHWATSSSIERIRTTVAQRHVLRVTYFKKWRAIASENQAKVRKILARKYLNVWREKTARRLLRKEQAVAHHEESLMRKYKTAWFWHFCSRRVEGWHEQWIEKRAFRALTSCLQIRQQHGNQADSVYHSQVGRRTLRTLAGQLQEQRQLIATAQQHHDQASTSKSLRYAQKQTKLAPNARTLRVQIDLNLKRKALRVWHLHLSLFRQAAEVDRKRTLQTAWTNWNDALRFKALAQKIDERVIVENLYRWVLQERMKLFQRTQDARLLRRALGWWISKVQGDRDKLVEAEVVFAERRRRQRMNLGILRLHIAMRSREDAERSALEMANSHALPKVLNAWKEKTDHTFRLAKWAADARFYCLCTSTLKIWREKTSEHKQNRRRAAYTQVRARVKIRLVRNCLLRWQTKTTEVHSMDDEAERRAQALVADVGAKSFYRWREKTAQYAELNSQSTNIDQRKLLGAAFSAMTLRHADFTGLQQQSLEFRDETDLSLLAGALRRVQWATFTVARKVESAEALWARNRDQHVRHMLRHWAGQVVARRSAVRDDTAIAEDQEADSPSLRPASRAATRIADLTLPGSPPMRSVVLITPGYLRTPSRSRRAARFRPLPAPTSFTPMAFDPAYLATTPAPVTQTEHTELEDSFAGLTPQVTPFQRKLRAGGFTPAPPSALKLSTLHRSPNLAGGTNKSVRFAGTSRFKRKGDDSHEKLS